MTITNCILHPVQQIRDKKRIDLIKKGWPEEIAPEDIEEAYLPISYTTLKEKNGTNAIGLTCSHRSGYKADPACLKSAQQTLQHIFQHFPKIMKVLKKGLPDNLVCVSWAESGFDVGDQTTDFRLAAGYSPGSYLVYQQLSPNVEISKYDAPDGKGGRNTFLAGVIYHMDKVGKARHVESDTALIRLARAGEEPFPLQDRASRKSQTYGRVCSRTGKQVVVDFSGTYGVPVRHVEYDHALNKWKYVNCEDCLMDFYTYKFETMRRNGESSTKKREQERSTPSCFSYDSKLSRFLRSPIQTTKEFHAVKKINHGYPIQFMPFIPPIMSQLNTWDTIMTRKGLARIGIARAPEGPQIVDLKSLTMIKNFILTICPAFEEFDVKKSRNAIAISFASPNFQVGHRCHEFNLIPEFKPAEDAFWSYQRLSPNIQVTYYNEGSNQFLAGICYFPVLNGKALLLRNDKALMTSMEYCGLLYPKKVEDVSRNGRECYGRYCGKSGKSVLVGKTEEGLIRHLEFNHWSREWKHVYCEECVVDWFEGDKKKEEVKEVKEENPYETPNNLRQHPKPGHYNPYLSDDSFDISTSKMTFRERHEYEKEVWMYRKYPEISKFYPSPVKMPVRIPLEAEDDASDPEEAVQESKPAIRNLYKTQEYEHLPYMKPYKPLSVAIDIPEELVQYAYKPPGSIHTFDVRTGEIISSGESKKTAAKPVSSLEVKQSRFDHQKSATSAPSEAENKKGSVPEAVELHRATEVSTTCILEKTTQKSEAMAEFTGSIPDRAALEATVNPLLASKEATCNLQLPFKESEASETNTPSIQPPVSEDPVNELQSVVNRLMANPVTSEESTALLRNIIETLSAAVNQPQMQEQGAGPSESAKTEELAPKASKQSLGASKPAKVADNAVPSQAVPETMLSAHSNNRGSTEIATTVDLARDQESKSSELTAPQKTFALSTATICVTIPESDQPRIRAADSSETPILTIKAPASPTNANSSSRMGKIHGTENKNKRHREAKAKKIRGSSKPTAPPKENKIDLPEGQDSCCSEFSLSSESFAKVPSGPKRPSSPSSVKSGEEPTDFEEISDPLQGSDEEYDIIEHDEQ